MMSLASSTAVKVQPFKLLPQIQCIKQFSKDDRNKKSCFEEHLLYELLTHGDISTHLNKGREVGRLSYLQDV